MFTFLIQVGANLKFINELQSKKDGKIRNKKQSSTLPDPQHGNKQHKQ